MQLIHGDLSDNQGSILLQCAIALDEMLTVAVAVATACIEDGESASRVLIQMYDSAEYTEQLS